MKIEMKLDDLNELKEEIEQLKYANENQIYKGNSISHIYDCYQASKKAYSELQQRNKNLEKEIKDLKYRILLQGRLY